MPIVISIALGVGFGASVFLNIMQHQRTQQDEKLLQGQISDLQYQVNEDRKAGSSPSPSSSPSDSPSPSASATPSPTPTPSTTVLGATTKTATVKKSGNVHVAASTSSKVVLSYTHLPVGATVTLGAATGQFQQITFNGITGYILASYLQL